jgi:hypothetical protein
LKRPLASFIKFTPRYLIFFEAILNGIVFSICSLLLYRKATSFCKLIFYPATLLKHLYTFIAALFTIAKLWKQPRCSTTDEWVMKMWYLYTMEFYSTTKKNEILSFASK